MSAVLETLGDRLAATRRARFVGREAELARFADAFTTDTPPFHVALVYGPGGIGKTSLLDELALQAREAGVGVARLDARDLRPSPEAVATAAEAVLEAAGDGRRLLLVDTYERIEGLDGWLRRTFVPSLRATDLVVLAGRNRPAAEWRSTWAGAVAEIPLRNLAPAEAEAFLDARGVPEAEREPVLAFTHGHPLALTLAAEWVRQRGDDAAFDPAEAPSLLGDLLARFVADVPTPVHRAALEGAALVRAVTVPLLDALLSPTGGDGAASSSPEALFEWVRDLAFTEVDAHGIRLHDVVRETIEADLRWRDPDRHAAFHERARHYYGARLRTARRDEDRRRALGDYLHLYRHHPVARPLLRRLYDSWAESDFAGSGPLRDGDAETVRALTAQHLGEAEAEAVAGWMERRPDAIEVFHTTDGSVAGALLTLPLDALDADARRSDPVVEATWGTVGSRLREGERGLLFRSWLDADAGQSVSAVQSLVFARTVERYLTTPGLASSVVLTSEPDLWGPVFTLVGLQRWPEAEAPGRETPLAAFGKDWRATPPDVWIEELAARAPGDPAPPAPDPDDALVVLSEEAFAEAVHEALKVVARPHRLAESPLLQARLVRERGGEPLEALQALLEEAAQQLADGVRERPYYRALDLTYFRPAPTQAIVAERLDLPFSTYRRHLRRGVDHVVEVLWRAETGG